MINWITIHGLQNEIKRSELKLRLREEVVERLGWLLNMI